MKAETEFSGKQNTFKWVVAFVLLGAAMGANYYFATQPAALRAVGWIVLSFLVGFILLTTSQGTKFIDFAKESRMEMRKVIWPTRQETVQTTLVVMGMVALTALLLWGIDSILIFLIGLLTGHKG